MFVGGVSYLIVMDDLCLLVGISDNGIYIFDIKNCFYIGKISVFVDGNIQFFMLNLNIIYFDFDNNLWISIMDEGVLYINFKCFKFRMFLLNYLIFVLCEMGKGEIFVVFVDCVYCINNYWVVGFILFFKLGGDFENLRFICQDENGNLWLGMEFVLLVKLVEKKHFFIFLKILFVVKNKQVFISMICFLDGWFFFVCIKVVLFII